MVLSPQHTHFKSMCNFLWRSPQRGDSIAYNSRYNHLTQIPKFGNLASHTNARHQIITKQGKKYPYVPERQAKELLHLPLL